MTNSKSYKFGNGDSSTNIPVNVRNFAAFQKAFWKHKMVSVALWNAENTDCVAAAMRSTVSIGQSVMKTMVLTANQSVELSPRRRFGAGLVRGGEHRSFLSVEKSWYIMTASSQTPACKFNMTSKFGVITQTQFNLRWKMITMIFFRSRNNKQLTPAAFHSKAFPVGIPYFFLGGFWQDFILACPSTAPNFCIALYLLLTQVTACTDIAKRYQRFTSVQTLSSLQDSYGNIQQHLPTIPRWKDWCPILSLGEHEQKTYPSLRLAGISKSQVEATNQKILRWNWKATDY